RPSLRRGGGRTGAPVDRDRLERSDQPDVVRDVRLPEAVRLQPREGGEAHDGRARQGESRGLERQPREGRVGRLASARPRLVGDHGTELMALKPRIRRTRKCTFALNIPREERDALRSLTGQLRDLLATDDPALERLFPPAYPADPHAQADFASVTHDDLRSGKLTSIEVMERTIDADRLDE